ncbi:Uncharacterized protein QTN25_004408 [Entamoeba marina]
MYVMLLFMVMLISDAQLYVGNSYNGFAGYAEISPLDACKGSLCKKQVKAIMVTCEQIEKNLLKLDETERALVAENEHDMTDVGMFTNHDELRQLRTKIRAQNAQLRKVRRTRVTLMRALHKSVGKLSIVQQGRLIRYLNLEHRIKVQYTDFNSKEILPKSFKTCKDKVGVDPHQNESEE